MPRWLSLLLLVVLSPPAPAEERVLVGCYATFGDLPVEQIPWERLTHVCHAYLRVDADGQLVTTDAMPNPAITADGRQNDTPVLVTLGGGKTVQGLEKLAGEPGAMRKLVGRVLKVVYEGGYDGVDLDWEFPRDAATRDSHAKLLTDLRGGLDELARRTQRETPYLLSATVTPSPFFGQWVDVERVAPAVDWLTVLAYDFTGPWSAHAGHPSPLFSSSKDPEGPDNSAAAAMRYWETERGAPKGKLVMGLPLFGRAMPAGEPYERLDPEETRHHRAMGFAAIRQRVGEGWPADWDDETKSPWLRKPPAEGEAGDASPLRAVDPDAYEGPVLIGYDDRNSIHAKATWAREQGYRGVAFWAVHQDRMPDGRHWLIDAAAKAWPAD